MLQAKWASRKRSRKTLGQDSALPGPHTLEFLKRLKSLQKKRAPAEARCGMRKLEGLPLELRQLVTDQLVGKHAGDGVALCAALEAWCKDH